MKKALVVIIVVLVIAVVAVLAYSVFKKPEEATGPLEAVPIAARVEQQASAVPTAEPSAQSTATPEPVPTEAPQAPAATDVPESTKVAALPTDAPEPTEAAASPTNPPPEPTTEDVSAVAIFEIVPGESQARFLIEEVLRGSPVTVVGSTSKVAGQLSVDPADLSTALVGTVLVNARTLETDNEFRNRAIKNRILKTDDFELITFVPKDIVGLAESGTVGQSYGFQLVGDLTVTDVTQQVTFEVTVTPVSESRIEGLAKTAFLYTDFGLAIPDSPSVDTVEDEVRLEFEFVAEAVQ